MNIIDKMISFMPELTKNEKRLAEYMINNPIDVVRYSSADQIARLNNCSRASLIRLTQKLGYDGFADFKYDFANQMVNHISTNTQTVLDYYATAITGLSNVYSSKGFTDAIELLSKAGHIYTSGRAHSNYSARQFAFRLNRSGFPATCIDSATSLDECPGLYKPGSVLVLFSISGGNYDNTFLQWLPKLKNTNQTKILLVTMTANTPYETYSHTTIVLPCVSRLCKTTMLDDAAVFYIAIEMIVDSLLNSKSSCHKEDM